MVEMLTDNEIVARVQNGERELFGELHTRHHDRVYRYVARSIFQREAAQDVTGEVWLRAYRAVDRFKPRDSNSVVAWLLRIATNLVTDYRRRLSPEVQIDDNESPTLRLVSPSADTEMLLRERARAVHEAMAELSPGDQQILFLAHQSDLSCAEIATVLNKPSVSAVTSHLHRAVKHLREQLRQSGWLSDGEEKSVSRRYSA